MCIARMGAAIRNQMDMALAFRRMDQQWLALLALWGKGLEAVLMCPGKTAKWPPTIYFYSPCVLDVYPDCSCHVMAGMDKLWT